MRNIFRLLVVVPIALLILAFAIANREFVKVRLDPFVGGDIESPAFEMPLFILMFITGCLGVFAGGVLVWWRQGRYRRQLRDAKAEAAEARGQAIDLRDRLSALETRALALPAPRKDAA